MGRPVLIRQSDATRLMKAAKAAGYPRVRLTRYPDGRIEVVGEPEEAKPAAEVSPFDAYMARKTANARS